MSLILDALKKSDAERQRSAAGRQVSAPAAQSPGLTAARMGLLLAAIAGSIAIGWYASQQSRDSQTQSEPAVQEQVTTLPVVVETPAPIQTPAPAPAAVRPLPDPKNQPTVAASAPQQQVDTRETVPVASIPPAEPALVDLDLQPPAPLAVVPAAGTAPGDTQKDTLATFAQLPAAVKSAIGDLTLNVLVFDQQGADRFVLINLRRYQSGEAINDHLAVVEIRADGAVLDFDGRRFLLDTRFR